jgi:hypothetical protein
LLSILWRGSLLSATTQGCVQHVIVPWQNEVAFHGKVAFRGKVAILGKIVFLGGIIILSEEDDLSKVDLSVPFAAKLPSLGKQHNNTTTQQHNNTTTQQHNNTLKVGSPHHWKSSDNLRLGVTMHYLSPSLSASHRCPPRLMGTPVVPGWDLLT